MLLAAEQLRAHIFISYARADKEFVSQLHDEIARKGRKLWVDWGDLEAFDRSWRATLLAAIEKCETFIFIMSPASVDSGVCAQEVAHAELHGKRLAVVVYQAVPDQRWRERMPSLETPQWFFFDHNDNHRSVDELLKALDSDQDHVQAHTRLYARAREWETSADESLLLRGADLRSAEIWLQPAVDKQPPPTPLHYRYLRDSRLAATRSLAAQLAAAAELSASQVDLTVSVLLAAEAYRLAPTPQIERVLRRGLRLPRLIWSYPAGAGPCRSTTSQDGRYAAVASGHSVRVFEIPSGEEIAALDHTGRVSLLMFSPKSRYLTTWEDTSKAGERPYGSLRVWEIRTGRLVAEFLSPEQVFCLQYDCAERYAVAGSAGTTAIVIDLQTGATISLKHRDAVVTALAFDASGTYLAAGQGGATPTTRGWRVPPANDLWVWRVRNWRPRTRIKRTGEVYRVAFDPNRELLVAACSRGQSCAVRVWHATHILGWMRFREIGSVEHWKPVNEIIFDPHFWVFATACDDGLVRILRTASDGERNTVGEQYRVAHDGPVNSVAFIPYDEHAARRTLIIASGGKDDRTAREWEGPTELTRAIHPSPVEQVRYSADRKLLISCTADGGVFAWASNQDQRTPNEVPTASLLEELSRRIQRNLTLEEWRSHFGDEPYRPTFEHLANPVSADRQSARP